MRTLEDPCEEVAFEAKQMLLPVVGIWALELGKLESHLLPALLNSLKGILQVSCL